MATWKTVCGQQCLSWHGLPSEERATQTGLLTLKQRIRDLNPRTTACTREHRPALQP